MDINQVRFGNYSLGNPKTASQKNEGKAEEKAKNAVNEGETQKFDVENLFNAMNIAGLQNKAQIEKASKKEVNPADYLSESRVSDIEAMMGKFENGVNEIANAIEVEFPQTFSQAQKNALAARIFAQE